MLLLKSQNKLLFFYEFMCLCNYLTAHTDTYRSDTINLVSFVFPRFSFKLNGNSIYNIKL